MRSLVLIQIETLSKSLARLPHSTQVTISHFPVEWQSFICPQTQADVILLLTLSQSLKAVWKKYLKKFYLG